MDFSEALTQIKAGAKIKRKGWNNPDQYIFLFNSFELLGSPVPPDNISSELKNTFIDKFVVIKTVQNTLVPWIASQTDLLAEDWEVING